ncbi:hypothetical protein HTZ84_09590 [Haloterrigena sp. SYSU A558-1]|uniref:Uncharacterized protein n=1 Tax=Haloterrigena gelatinilytica TaxID=2741724 RepID=A0ABX2LDY0_9EURY|nr:hypothetical protein [Haloterrigena gelatinilytica]NUC72558.1 hypothetical protein [Haloterrigena gelatinilytica]
MTYLQSFSSGYLIAPEVDVRPFSGRNAAVAHDLYDDLEDVVGSPVYVAVSGVRYRVRPEYGIPADTVALPHHKFPFPHKEGDTLLVERDGAVGGRFG